jgi:protein arginine N-methyltransferase 1
MYSLEQFANMFSDPLRMDAYRGVIAKTVKPGSVVVDLGCGPGVFAMLACQAGARRVYAIDLNGVVDFGRHLAAANGMADRVEFFCGDSRQIELPERADVIVSDLRGALPLHSHAIATLEDARTRFLAEGGRLIPLSDTLICALIESEEAYREVIDSWKAVPQLDLSSGLPIALNSVYHPHLEPRHLVSEPERWLELDYRQGAQTHATKTMSLTAQRDATTHGLGLWFETDLGEGFGYSTAPGTGDRVYGHKFLPWLEPLPLRQGDTCCVTLGAHLVAGNYIWQWETRVPSGQGRPEAHFRQSTFYGSILSPSYLKKHATEFVPVLSEEGLAERWLLQSMDGRRALQQIAEEAAGLFPHVFPSVQDAYARAAEIAERLAR